MGKINRFEYDGTEFSVELFENVHDLLQVNEKRKMNFTDGGKDNPSWAGATIEEAFDMVANGWNEKVKEIVEDVNKLSKKSFIKSGIKFSNDIVGFTPHVPNLLAGVPQTMINSKIVSKKAKVLTIVYDGDVHSGTSSQSVLNYSKKVMAYIMSLEKEGYRVRLYAMNSYNRSHRSHSMLLRLKDEFQPLDLKRLMFPMCHSAYQRIIGFDWYEKFPNAEHFSGYGQAFHYCFGDEKKKEFVKRTLGKNAHYLHYGDDVERLDSKLKNSKGGN